MSEKHPIDELFRSGLDGKGAAYSDAHWQAMEQMLEGSRKGFFARYRVYLISALLLLLLGLGYWPIPENGNNTATKDLIADQQTSNNNALQEDEPSGLSNKTIAAPASDNRSEEDTEVSAEEIQLSNNSTAPTAAAEGESFIDEVLPTAAQEEYGVESREYGVGNEDQREEKRYYEHPRLTSRSIGGFDVKEFLKIPLREKELWATPRVIKTRRLAWYANPYLRYDNYQRTIPGDMEAGPKSAEQTISNWNYGLHIGAGKGNWIIQSGIEFTALRERTNYETVIDNWNYDSTLVMRKPDYTETPRGTRVALLGYEIDSTNAQERYTDCPDCEVQFNYLTIPLNAQYNIGLGRHSLFAEVGVRYSFLLSAKGQYHVNTNDSETSQTVDLKSGDFLERSFLSAQAAIGYKFHLNHRLALTGAFEMSSSLGSIFRDYEHNVRLNGLRVGMEWRIH